MNRYKTMPQSSANAALQQIGSSPCPGFSINDNRRLLAAAVAARRREVLLLLAGNYSEDALYDFVDGLCQQAADNPSGFETSFRTTARESGTTSMSWGWQPIAIWPRPRAGPPGTTGGRTSPR